MITVLMFSIGGKGGSVMMVHVYPGVAIPVVEQALLVEFSK
jgi:hypothetical protein